MQFVPREKTTGELIRMARIARGMTGAELAYAASLRPITFYRWESGKIVPNRAKCNRLCIVLGIPLGSLCGSDQKRARRAGRLVYKGRSPFRKKVGGQYKPLPEET